ncbi:MAG: hypothetical protein IJW33_04340, partial [Lentisphaeria bacterium]|nr:hypothetical protein [Lentisphaeria bacterium]
FQSACSFQEQQFLNIPPIFIFASSLLKIFSIFFVNRTWQFIKHLVALNTQRILNISPIFTFSSDTLKIFLIFSSVPSAISSIRTSSGATES